MKGGGAVKKKVVGVDKYNHPPAKFEEKPHQRIGKERGTDVCEHCYGTCCAATRHLIRSLVDIGELRPDVKTGGSYYCSIVNI